MRVTTLHDTAPCPNQHQLHLLPPADHTPRPPLPLSTSQAFVWPHELVFPNGTIFTCRGQILRVTGSSSSPGHYEVTYDVEVIDYTHSPGDSIPRNYGAGRGVRGPGRVETGCGIGSTLRLELPTFLPHEIVHVPGLAPQPPATTTCEDLFGEGGIRHIPAPLGMTTREDGRSRLLYGFEQEPKQPPRRTRAEIENRLRELDERRAALRAKLDALADQVIDAA